MQQEAGSMGNERVTLHLPKAHSPHPLASFHRLLREGIHWTRCPNLQSKLPPFSLKNQQVASLKPTRSTSYFSLACNTDRTSKSSDCLSVTCQFCFSLLHKTQAPVMPQQPVTQETSPMQSCRSNLLHKTQAPVMPQQPVTQETSPMQSCRSNLLHRKCHPFCLWATEQATPLQPVTPITPITPLQPVTPVTPITPLQPVTTVTPSSEPGYAQVTAP